MVLISSFGIFCVLAASTQARETGLATATIIKPITQSLIVTSPNSQDQDVLARFQMTTTSFVRPSLDLPQVGYLRGAVNGDIPITVKLTMGSAENFRDQSITSVEVSATFSEMFRRVKAQILATNLQATVLLLPMSMDYP